jgi:hypothetical protein
VDGNGKQTELLRQILAELVAVNAKADQANAKADQANAKADLVLDELRALRHGTEQGFQAVDVAFENVSTELAGIRTATQDGLELLSRADSRQQRQDDDLRERVARIEQHLGLQ